MAEAGPRLGGLAAGGRNPFIDLCGIGPQCWFILPMAKSQLASTPSNHPATAPSRCHHHPPNIPPPSPPTQNKSQPPLTKNPLKAKPKHQRPSPTPTPPHSITDTHARTHAHTPLATRPHPHPTTHIQCQKARSQSLMYRFIMHK